MRAVDAIEWACALCGHCIQNDWVSRQQICIKFWVKLEDSFAETIQMTEKAAAMGSWWLAASSWQHSCITSHAVLGKTSNHPGDPAPLQSRFGALRPLAFSKIKITFRFQTINEIQENTMGQLMAIPTKDFAECLNSGRYAGKVVWGPKVPTLKGTKAWLSYVQCFLFLVSSSINASIFHTIWLDTFWTDYYINTAG